MGHDTDAGRQTIAQAGRLNVHGHFNAAVRRAPDAIALEDEHLRLTYGELAERVLRLAAALRTRGVGRGDRIALLSQNRFEYAEYQLAAAAIGAIVACQNWRLSLGELQHCVSLIEPRLLVSSERFVHLARALDLADCPISVIEIEHETMIEDHAPLADLPSVDEEDGLVILYTSGTTGLPKGALISHRAEVARNAVLRMDLGLREGDGFIAWAPMFHMGSTDQVLGALMSGGTVTVVDGFSAETIVSAMERHPIGWMLLMPGSMEPVVELLRQTGRRPRCIRAVGAMADLVPRHLIAELSLLAGAPYLNSFGSTETGLAPLSGMLIEPGAILAGLSKRRSALCDLRLLDPSGNDAEPGTPGEAAVRGPTVFSGYWNAHETNARDFADGWFRMGDLFRRNADGSYDFVDRAKYMIKSGGENIYPAEIERVILSDPRVSDAIVVRRADDRWGEVPVAFVSRQDDVLSADDLTRLCRERLAGYKRPKEIHFVAFEEFPRSTTGKILRHEMEARLKRMGPSG